MAEVTTSHRRQLPIPRRQLPIPGGHYQSPGGHYQSPGGHYQSPGGGFIAYSGPYQYPTGNFKIDTRNALFDDYIEFKGIQSVQKLKTDYNPSFEFNQSIDGLISELITLDIPPSTQRGDAIDLWVDLNFNHSDQFDPSWAEAQYRRVLWKPIHLKSKATS